MSTAEKRVGAGTHAGTNGTQKTLPESYPAGKPSTAGSQRPSTTYLSARRS